MRRIYYGFQLLINLQVTIITFEDTVLAFRLDINYEMGLNNNKLNNNYMGIVP